MEPETFASLIKHDTGSVRIISGRSESLGKLHVDGVQSFSSCRLTARKCPASNSMVAVARQNERLRDPFGLSGMVSVPVPLSVTRIRSFVLPSVFAFNMKGFTTTNAY